MRKELHASLHPFTLSLFISIVQHVHGVKKKPKHVRMSTGRELAAEEVNKNTWKHIIRDSLSSALLGPQLKDIQECLPLLYIKLATARESTGKCNQSWPECVLWAELTTANDVKGKSKEKDEQSFRCSCDPGCIHTANQTGLKLNLSPTLFTLQSVKGHILKLTWTATRIWGGKKSLIQASWSVWMH